eukprot:g3961.t1
MDEEEKMTENIRFQLKPGKRTVSDRCPHYSTTKRTKKDRRLAVFSEDDDAESTEELKAKQERQEEKGASLAESGDFVGALRVFDAIIARGGKSAEVYEMRAQVLMQLKRDFDAIRSAEMCRMMRPEWSVAWQTLGRAQLNFGEVKLALDSFLTSQRLAPDDTGIRKDVACAEDLLKRLKKKTGVVATRARVGTGDAGVTGGIAATSTRTGHEAEPPHRKGHNSTRG